MGFASKESECEVQYDEPLIQKTFMKSFETGLRDDILATNLRPILRTSGLIDEELMKHVNELATSKKRYSDTTIQGYRELEPEPFAFNVNISHF